MPKSASDRYRLILRCADGLRNTEVAAELGLSVQTVGKWRQRFVEGRFDGLEDSPRSGRPRTSTDDEIQAILAQPLHGNPKGATHGSLRMMTDKSNLSHTPIWRIWGAYGLPPHRSETCKLSTDPHVVDKVRDSVGLYLSPPDRARVWSVDEKSPIQALDRTQPVLPMNRGDWERATHDDKRHGTPSLFAALDTATGRVLGKCYNRHRSQEFLAFLTLVEKNVPKDLDVQLILDNYGTHKTEEVRNWL